MADQTPPSDARAAVRESRAIAGAECDAVRSAVAEFSRSAFSSTAIVGSAMAQARLRLAGAIKALLEAHPEIDVFELRAPDEYRAGAPLLVLVARQRGRGQETILASIDDVPTADQLANFLAGDRHLRGLAASVHVREWVEHCVQAVLADPTANAAALGDREVNVALSGAETEIIAALGRDARFERDEVVELIHVALAVARRRLRGESTALASVLGNECGPPKQARATFGELLPAIDWPALEAGRDGAGATGEGGAGKGHDMPV